MRFALLLRSWFLPLLIGMSLASALLQLGCGRGSASKCDEVNWGEFTPMQREGFRDSSLQEMADSVDFRFVLPSCLPKGISRSFLLSTQWPQESVTQGVAGLTLFPAEGSSAPGVQIVESLSSGMHLEPDSNTEVVLDTLVECVSIPPGIGFDTSTSGAMLSCRWYKDDIEFRVDCAWESSPSPGQVSPEMREEAMKVIASMIEAPYIP